MPLVTILTPTYNCAAYLTRTWFCIKNQTFKEWEWLVVDDGSTDNTEALVKSFKDPRIRYHKLPENKGRGGARAAGLALAAGPYIAIWDADDIYPPERLAIAMTELQAQQADFWCSHSLLLDNNLTPTGIRTWPSLPECPRLFVFHTLVAKREILQTIGFDARWRAAEDYRPLLFLIMHYHGAWHAAPLACYIENREATLAKAILTNRNQFAQFCEMLAHREFKPPLANPAFIKARYRLKVFLLNLMRIWPPLYQLTLNLRQAERNLTLSGPLKDFLDQMKKVAPQA